MGIKEDIEILRGMKDGNVPSSYSEFCKEYNNKLDKIIKRLQMREDFKKEYGEYRIDCEDMDDIKVGKAMDDFEEKYFSKRINRIIEVEVEASNMEVIDELAKDIQDMANGQSHRKGKIGVINTRWVRD